jgi:CrcB protein
LEFIEAIPPLETVGMGYQNVSVADSPTNATFEGFYVGDLRDRSTRLNNSDRLIRRRCAPVVSDGVSHGSCLYIARVGSFGLGLLTFGGAGGEATLLFGVGACGAYTTFSSFAYDAVRMAETGEARVGVAYALGTLLAALAAVGLAWLLVA